MAGLSSLEIAKRGLQAQQYALDVTSNNIANVNTEGYSRRTAITVESSPRISEGMSYGTGVLVEGVQTYRQEFFDKEIRANISSLAGYDTDVEVYSKIEAILSEPSSQGLSESVTEFFTAFDQLAMTPEDEALRLYTVELTQTMCEQFNNISGKLSELKDDINDQMNSQLLLANTLISDIAGLNKAIALSGADTGQDIQTYYDQRELKLEKLSGITDVSVAAQTDGQANIYANGINIVSDSNYSELKIKTSVDPETKELTADLYAYDPIRKKETLIEPNTGKLSTYMKHFNQTLDANEQKQSAFSVIRSLDTLAGTLGEKVNALALEGYGLDDTTLQERAIFMPAENGESITAETLKLNPELRQNSRSLPIASAPGVSGNNDVALKIARLAQNANFIDQQTANEFYAGFLGQFATYSKYANSNQSRLQLVSDQLGNQRQSIVGVNEDEEAISLVKYQRVYESCARLVATLNEMLQVMVNLGR